MSIWELSCGGGSGSHSPDFIMVKPAIWQLIASLLADVMLNVQRCKWLIVFFKLVILIILIPYFGIFMINFHAEILIIG